MQLYQLVYSIYVHIHPVSLALQFLVKALFLSYFD